MRTSSKSRANLFRHAAQLQVAALGAQLAKAGEHGAESGTVHKTQPAQIEHQLGIGLQHGRDVALELWRVARVQFIHRHFRDGNVVHLIDSYFH